LYKKIRSFIVFASIEIIRLSVKMSLLFTYIGFFIFFNSSSVFQYFSHLYLGLLFPIRRWLRIWGPLRRSLKRLSSLRLKSSDSSNSLEFLRNLSSPLFSSSNTSGVSLPSRKEDGRRCKFVRDVCERDLIKLFNTPFPCVAIGCASSVLRGR
jgi:hypothetical protein